MMKSKIRFVLLAVLMALMVIAPATTVSRAQDSSMCLPGMDADTCALFTAALANSATLTKFNMDYDVAMKTVGTTSDIDLTVKGSGPIDVSGLATAAMSGGTSDPSALLNGLVMQQAIDASMTSAGSTIAGKFEFRIVEGVLYYNGDLATQGKWMKLDLMKALASASAQLGQMQSQMAGASNGAMSAAMSPELAKLFADPTKFFSTEVTDGPEVDGVATQEVKLNVNVQALVETIFSPEARPLLIEIMKAQGQEVTPDLEKQLDQMTMVLRAIAPTLEATKLSVSWLIDPEAKQFRGFGINFNTVVDKSTAALMQATSEITVDFSFLVKLSAIGEDVTVEPVSDAVDASAGMSN
ncbi:MAG: hypothetical protein KF716_11845 [Anaerolineae bacterium]|nr:hypothetical protein [Anaerolineae bacterium]